MSFQAPIGSPEEIATGRIWPGRWVDATPYLTHYSYGYHTGADLNLNYPVWDADQHSDVYAMGEGKVTYAKLFSTQYWGNIIVIDHGTVDGMPLFSRYILKSYLYVLLLCVVSFIALLLVSRLQEIAHFASMGAPPLYLIYFILYQIPYVLPIAIPIMPCWA